MVPMSNDNICLHCKRPNSPLFCQRCQGPYCGPTCQIADWERHKYTCLAMPKLVTADKLRRKHDLKLEKAEGSTSPSLLDEVDVKSHVPRSSIWEQPSLLAIEDFTACTVSRVDQHDPAVVWVVRNDELNDLKEMHRSIWTAITRQQQRRRKAWELNIGDLVIALMNCKGYRLKVETVDNILGKVFGLLIDFGETSSVDVSNIYETPEEAYDIAAFATCVQLPEEAERLTKGERVTLRVVQRNPERENVYFAEIKPTLPIALLNESLMRHGQIQLQNVLEDDHMAVVQLVKKADMAAMLLEIFPIYWPYDRVVEQEKLKSIKENSFVVVYTVDDWCRAYLLQKIPGGPSLVYLVDKGRMYFAYIVREMPKRFLSEPLQTFLLSFTPANGLNAELLKGATHLKLVPDSPVVNTMPINCKLNMDEEIIDNVRVYAFHGPLMPAMKYWLETLCDGDYVVIQTVLSHYEVMVAPTFTCEYRKWFTATADECKPYLPDEVITCDELVLFKVPDSEFFARGEVQATPRRNGMFTIYDIDTGHSFLANREDLRKLTGFARSCPVFLHELRLNQMDKLPAHLDKGFVRKKLAEMVEDQKFYLHFVENRWSNLVDLKFEDRLDRSLSDILLSDLLQQPGKQAVQAREVREVAPSARGRNIGASHDGGVDRKRNFSEQKSQSECSVKEIHQIEKRNFFERKLQSQGSEKASRQANKEFLQDNSFGRPSPSQGSKMGSRQMEKRNFFERREKETPQTDREDSFERQSPSQDSEKESRQTDKESSFGRPSPSECSEEDSPQTDEESSFKRSSQSPISDLRQKLDRIALPQSQPRFPDRDNKNNNKATAGGGTPQCNQSEVDSRETPVVRHSVKGQTKPLQEQQQRGCQKQPQRDGSGQHGSPALCPKQIKNDPLVKKEPPLPSKPNENKENEEIKEEKAQAQEPQASAAETATTRFTYNDISIIPLPEGPDVQLQVLDCSLYERTNAISVSCKRRDETYMEYLKNLQLLNKYISEHLNNSTGSYTPQHLEACFAKFSDDRWYRAVNFTKNASSDGLFNVLYVDFGNKENVSAKDIRPMVKELMFPTATNICLVKGVHPQDTQALLKFLEASPVITCTVHPPVDEVYTIEIDDLAEILAKLKAHD